MPQAIDHLVYATTNLDRGIEEIAELLGVPPAPGGQHTGLGTRNALLSLGRGTYLEVIGPDPAQPPPARLRPFGIDSLRESRLVTWLARVTNIEEKAEAARHAGYDPGPVTTMNRALPDGSVLKWKLTMRASLPGDGIVPFLIEWDTHEHPSRTAPGGCSLIDLEAEHPHPEAIQPMLDALGAELQVSEGGRPALLATIECPRGTVVLS
jgi:hypothetical protein